MKRPIHLLVSSALVLLVLALVGCATQPAAQAEPAPPPSDILSTPPPMPPSEPGPPTPTPPEAPAAAPQLAGARVTLLSTGFADTTSLADWRVIDSTDLIQFPSIWAIQNGRLAQVSDGDGLPSMYATALVTGEPTWTNYTASVAAYPQSNDEIGIVVRASDAGYYVFRLLPDGAQTTRILSHYDATTQEFTDIATAGGSGFTNNRWYTLRVEVRGDRLQAFVDGTPILDARDSTLSQGQVGVYGYAQGGLLFDNLTVYALPN